MANDFLSAINIVYAAEKREHEQIAPAPDSSAVSLTQFEGLLKKGIETFSTHQITKGITDKPFEIFWGNPYEPRHSKLLAYFLNPREDHCFGEALLQRFLDVLEDANEDAKKFKADELCEVQNEIEHIDLLITRKTHNDVFSERISKYAIIIENKVNGACDEPEQLQRYCDGLLGRFTKDEIFVYYMPLSSGMACADSIGNLPNVKAISFRVHIAKWLTQAVEFTRHRDGADALAMSQNLQHYLNLINYLLKQEKATARVNDAIFNQLVKADDGKNLPTLKDIQNLQKYATILETNFKKLMNRKILNRVYEMLSGKFDGNVHFYDSREERPYDEKRCSRPFQDPRRTWNSVGIEVTSHVLVTFTILDSTTPNWWIACRPLNWDKGVDAGYLKCIDPESKSPQDGQAVEWSYYYEQSDTYVNYISWTEDAERVAQRLTEIVEKIRLLSRNIKPQVT